jgi:hypothetical protein
MRIPGMKEQAAQRDEFNWWLPLCGVGGGSLLLLLLFVISADADLLYIFFVGPVACLVWLVLLIASAIRKKLRRSLSMLLTLTLFVFVSAALLKNEAAFRDRLRWLLFSREFKTQVLAQPLQANGELKHLEWDGWGFAPVGDWTAYVVFDPTDSLSTVAKSNSSGKVPGIPCNVDVVRRLESHWYSVTMSMNEWWDRCGNE